MSVDPSNHNERLKNSKRDDSKLDDINLDDSSLDIEADYTLDSIEADYTLDSWDDILLGEGEISDEFSLEVSDKNDDVLEPVNQNEPLENIILDEEDKSEVLLGESEISDPISPEDSYLNDDILDAVNQSEPLVKNNIDDQSIETPELPDEIKKLLANKNDTSSGEVSDMNEAISALIGELRENRREQRQIEKEQLMRWVAQANGEELKAYFLSKEKVPDGLLDQKEELTEFELHIRKKVRIKMEECWRAGHTLLSTLAEGETVKDYKMEVSAQLLWRSPEGEREIARIRKVEEDRLAEIKRKEQERLTAIKRQETEKKIEIIKQRLEVERKKLAKWAVGKSDAQVKAYCVPRDARSPYNDNLAYSLKKAELCDADSRYLLYRTLLESYIGEKLDPSGLDLENYGLWYVYGTREWKKQVIKAREVDLIKRYRRGELLLIGDIERDLSSESAESKLRNSKWGKAQLELMEDAKGLHLNLSGGKMSTRELKRSIKSKRKLYNSFLRPSHSSTSSFSPSGRPNEPSQNLGHATLTYYLT